MILESPLPLFAVLFPLLSVFFIPFCKEKDVNKVTAISTILSLIAVGLMYPSIQLGNTLFYVINTGFRVKLAFMADSLSFLVGFVAIILWMFASIYSVGYMAHEHALKRYNMFSLLSLTGMLGVVFTRNLFSLYIFFEMLSLCSYVMVIHEETEEAKKAGLTYLFMGVTGGLILLFSIVATYSITGTGDLSEISKMGLGLKNHAATPFIFLGFIIGFGVKAGLFPVHIWLPSAHPIAPSPASALLSGVMIKAGAYGIIRTIISIMGVDVMKGSAVITLILIFAFVNIFLGSALAIRQTEIKKMLAYSSIAQMGYIILGATLLTPLGLTGGVLHLFNHAIIKGTLFLCAGAFIHQTGLRQLEELKGIGKRMPITTLCFTLAALSMIGFPPFNGFIGKWYLALGSLEVIKMNTYESTLGMIALGMLCLSSFMNLIYYGPIIYRAWFVEPNLITSASNSHGDGHNSDSGDPSWWMKGPLLILGSATLFFGIFPQFPLKLAQHISSIYLGH